MLAVANVVACGGKAIHLGDGRTDGGSCPHAQVKASEVLWAGHTWVVIPGRQHTQVRDLARAANAIGQNEDYVIEAAAAATMADIADQYTAREAGATKVKVLIFDGGTWDTIVANGSDASVSSVAATFTQLLAQVARDATVEHIIYFLEPELPGIPGVAALRPLLKQACAQSQVPCHFLDLQPVWAGHPEYTAAGSIPYPTDAGAGAIADAIWSVMQQGCIAQ
jgi:hypothetical protein